MPKIVSVKVPFVIVEIHGPLKPGRGWVGDSSTIKAQFQASATAGIVNAVWKDVNANDNLWVEGGDGPAFFEDTPYRLWIKTLQRGYNPLVVSRDPYLFQEIDSYPDEGIRVIPFNFKRQVGLSSFDVRVGHETLSITIEVFPTKIDYRGDYEKILSEISAAARGLALEYLRATYRSVAVEDTDGKANIEWLVLVRNQMEIIAKSIRYVAAHPNRQLSNAIDDIKIENVRRANASVRRAILKRQGRGDWVDVPGLGLVRSVIPALRHQETLDTSEHRWLRLNLIVIRDKLSQLHGTLVGEINQYRRSGRVVGQRILLEEAEVADFIKTLTDLIGLPIFENITGNPPPGFSSLVLISGVGYSDAYRAMMVLKLGLSLDDGEFNVSVSDVNDLYEVWCFIEIARIITRITGTTSNYEDLLQVRETGIRVRLQRGKRKAVTYGSSSDTRKLILAYNLSFDGLTGDQRPDITLRLQYDGWPDLVILFDAKYRLDASDEYKQRFKIAGPPQDAINALHRYRDAIVVETTGAGLHRPVVKGVALFPLPLENHDELKVSPLFESITVLGIGALPFLPSTTQYVENWLKELLEATPESLAEPGPPFAGLLEKYRRGLVR